MTGIEIACRTLNMEHVPEPCILSCWVMNPDFFERVTGRDFFADRVGVACETFRRLGANLCPQLALPHQRGKKPILWGSVSVTTTLPWGTVEDVKRDVERCFDLAAPGGGFGLASTSSILPETPMENVLALFEHGRTYGRKVLGG